MLKACVEIVGKLGMPVGKLEWLCTKSTAGLLYLTSQVFLMRQPGTVFKQNYELNPHPKTGLSSQLAAWLYPLSTNPMNATNLIKEYYS